MDGVSRVGWFEAARVGGKVPPVTFSESGGPGVWSGVLRNGPVRRCPWPERPLSLAAFEEEDVSRAVGAKGWDVVIGQILGEAE